MGRWVEFLGEVGSATSGDSAVVPPSCSEASAAFRSSRSGVGGAWCGHDAPRPSDALLAVPLPLHRANRVATGVPIVRVSEADRLGTGIVKIWLPVLTHFAGNFTAGGSTVYTDKSPSSGQSGLNSVAVCLRAAAVAQCSWPNCCLR